MQQNITQDMRFEVEKLYARRAQAFAEQALKLDAN